MPSEALPALRTNPSFIFFTDFDGTITQQDSNDYLADNLGYGHARLRAENIAVLEHRLSFRALFQNLTDAVSAHHSFPECVDVLLKNITLDPHFASFYRWARASNVPVVIVSSGMKEIIHALLAHLLGEEDVAGIEIVSNEVMDKPRRDQPGSWTVRFHDESDFGHDKSLTIKPYAALPRDQRPTLFFAGDGTSDFSAARETDLLFAKAGRDLVTYCERDGIPFVKFADWRDILETTRAIVEGTKTVEEALSKQI